MIELLQKFSKNQSSYQSLASFSFDSTSNNLHCFRIETDLTRDVKSVVNHYSLNMANFQIIIRFESFWRALFQFQSQVKKY